MPKSLDPKLASAPPETDIVRAVFEGLTETDPRTLVEIPAAAEKWEASNGFRTWMFFIRKDAKWSNGESVTAHDFVRSWKRLVGVGTENAHGYLIDNIVGMSSERESDQPITEESADFLKDSEIRNENSQVDSNINTNSTVDDRPSANIADIDNADAPPALNRKITSEAPLNRKIGVEAVSDHILRVDLLRPDKEFPQLAAHSIFRPVYDDGKQFAGANLNSTVITNGPFGIDAIGPEGITLKRADFYWDRDSVKIDSIRMIPLGTVEMALDAYRAGEIDAISNAEFKPLVLKLLTPYGDFRKTTHGALNFYDVNTESVPFNDRRVREALAITINRERITEGEMKGTSQPAYSYLPFRERAVTRLTEDVGKGKELLGKAGYPDGEGFPIIRLVINRNDAQQRIAKMVARMWKEELNIETELVVLEGNGFKAAMETGDFDLIRRGIVLPTTSTFSNFSAIFGADRETNVQTLATDVAGVSTDTPNLFSLESPGTGAGSAGKSNSNSLSASNPDSFALSEQEAIVEMFAIPLYFPTSYTLVKPYVYGFDSNSLDAPSLKNVSIDINWKEKQLSE
ncbi:MAG: peptide ABC transporter substrate-binding protein [Pyrinomonadaceae bacterium]